MAMAASRTRRETVYRISVRVRSDVDLFVEWVEVGHHTSSSRALPALREWLIENEPLLGEYEAKSTRGGYYARDHYWGPE